VLVILPYRRVPSSCGGNRRSGMSQGWWRSVRPVRIAQVSDCFAPRTGGIETQVASLAARQVQAGHDVQVITATPDGEGAGTQCVDGIRIHRLSVNFPFQLPIHPRTAHAVAQTLAANPVDVVHVHMGVISPFAWGAVRAALRLDIPVLVTVHSMWGGIARPGYAAVEQLVHRSPRRIQISAVSSVAALRVQQALPSLGPIVTIPNGIDAQVWAVSERPGMSTRILQDPLQVVSVLRMAPRKRTLPLLRIAHQALELGASVNVTLVGDGPERAKAEKYVGRQGLQSHIFFLGRLTPQEIRAQFASSELFIQPSVQESFGIAALEARTAGLPVLARSQTGTVDFVREGVEGVLVDDDAGMAKALAQLALDRRTLGHMAQHNREVLPEQIWPTVLDRVDAAYGSLLSGDHLGSQT
jgi:glycosyltransferase involved in cell wall biosynthesis